MPQYDGSIKFLVDVDSDAGEQQLERFGKQAQATETDAQNLVGTTDKISGANAAASASFAATTAALVAAGAAAVNTSSEFEAAYAKTQTIMDMASVSAADMREDILDLSASSGMAASDVSEAVYQAISGSVATADAAAFVDRANKLSVAGFTSLSNATDVLTTTLNAYHLSADKVNGISNVLIQTQNLGKTSVDELSGSIGRAIATGAAYGVNLQNLSTAYVELTRGGISTAESTTYLSGMLNELGKSNSSVAKIIEEKTGKSFGTLMADGASLADVLQILLTNVDGNSEAFMNLWGSQEAGKAAAALAKAGIEDFNSVLADMNQQMDDATGTTDKAYEMMTETSEFIDRKFRVSLENLGVAVGDQLRPGLDGAKELLTDILGGMTEFVAENPWVVAALEGTAAATAILAAGLLLGSSAFSKLRDSVLAANAAMMANPYLLAGAAIAGLVTAIFTLVSAADDGTQSVDALTQAATALQNTLEESEKTYTDTVEHTTAAYDVAERYIDTLERLDAKTILTAEEQRAYHGTLMQLCATIPELSDIIDLETDAIDGGAQALRERASAWKADALEQAKQEKLAAVHKAYADALVERQIHEQKLADLVDKRRALEAQIAECDAENTKIWEDYNAQVAAGTNAEYDYAAAMEDVQAKRAEYEAQLDDLHGEEVTLTQAVEDGKEALAAAAEQVELAENALESLAQTEDNANGAADGLTEKTDALGAANAALRERVDAAAQTMQTAYADAQTAAYESISSQLGLFADMTDALNDMASATEDDAQSMIDALNSQLDYMDTYASNMRIAAAKGVDEGLLAELNDGSAESATILAGLVTMTDNQVREMNAKFAKVSEGKKKFAAGLAEYDSAVLDAKEKMVSTAAEAGVDMSGKMTQELIDGLPYFENALGRYSSAVYRAHNLARDKMSGIIDLPGYASGTSYAWPGIAIVGENGPELIYFQGGERVLPAAETRSVLSAAQQARAVAATTPTYLGSTPDDSGGLHGGGVGGGSTTVTVPLYVDGREFARATAQYTSEELMYV